jgi:NADH-quinone oxidoreductase subunit F
MGGNGITKLVLGYGTCGIAAGANAVKEALERELAGGKYRAELDIAGCMGFCFREPIVEVVDPSGLRVVYGDLTAKRVPQLLETHLVKGEIIDDWVVRRSDDPSSGEGDFLANQHRIVLRNCGNINPESIDELMVPGG